MDDTLNNQLSNHESDTLPANLQASDVELRERHELGRVLVPLMKGVIYKDSDAERWDSLLRLQARVQDHITVLGLELHLDEAEGYAFLRTREVDEDSDELPRLMTRRALSFPVSLLLALLRKRLAEFDAVGGDTRLVLTRDELVDMLRLFLPDTSNEARLIDQVDTHIKKIVELGFLRKMKVNDSSDKLDRYEVKRLIRAFVDAQWLSSFDERLAEYAEQLKGDEAEKSAEELSGSKMLKQAESESST